MSRTRIVVGLVALVLGSGGWLLGQDAKKEGKYKGQLPAGWKKLALNEEQVQKIYKIQTDYPPGSTTWKRRSTSSRSSAKASTKRCSPPPRGRA